MKNIFKILTICFCLIGITSCEDKKTYEEYVQEVGERIDKITLTTKIERDGHTYIFFHKLNDVYGVVHDPECCDNHRSDHE